MDILFIKRRFDAVANHNNNYK